MDQNLKKLCNTALGIALFVVLSLCVRVPVFENYYICLGYVSLAVYCYSFDTMSGTLTGTIGVILYCILTDGLRGMPGWTMGNLVIGIVLGITFKRTKKMENRTIRTMINMAVITLSTAVGILGVKSFIESVLYAQPFILRAAKNSYAFIADVVTLLASLPLCVMLDKMVRRDTYIR